VKSNKTHSIPGNEGEKQASRRTLLGATAAGALTGIAGAVLSSPSLATEAPAGKKLIVYFSKTGNTREVATQIQAHVGGDLFEVKTVTPYPTAYRATTDQARREQDANARPAIVGDLNDPDSHGVVFVGYPNWWGTLPMAYFTFFDRHKFAGKILIPFCTHEGSGLGRGPADLKALCPNANVLKGLALHGGDVDNLRTASARRDVEEWLRRLGFVG